MNFTKPGYDGSEKAVLKSPVAASDPDVPPWYDLYKFNIFDLPVNLLAHLIATSLASDPLKGKRNPVMDSGVTSFKI